METRTIPTALRRVDAAVHCAVSPGFFDRMVEEGSLPKPRLLGGTVKVWLRTELDQALYALPTVGGETTSDNPCDVLLRR
jgi:predicted DNA-binding transcriptional regulator AlpA